MSCSPGRCMVASRFPASDAARHARARDTDMLDPLGALGRPPRGQQDTTPAAPSKAKQQPAHGSTSHTWGGGRTAPKQLPACRVGGVTESTGMQQGPGLQPVRLPHRGGRWSTATPEEARLAGRLRRRRQPRSPWLRGSTLLLILLHLHVCMINEPAFLTSLSGSLNEEKRRCAWAQHRRTAVGCYEDPGKVRTETPALLLLVSATGAGRVCLMTPAGRRCPRLRAAGVRGFGGFTGPCPNYRSIPGAGSSCDEPSRVPAAPRLPPRGRLSSFRLRAGHSLLPVWCVAGACVPPDPVARQTDPRPCFSGGCGNKEALGYIFWSWSPTAKPPGRQRGGKSIHAVRGRVPVSTSRIQGESVTVVGPMRMIGMVVVVVESPAREGGWGPCT